jgi:hypothetical protein
MVVIFTALSLAAAYGWLAGFVRQTNGDLSFHWRWLVLVWAVVGFASTVYFWRKIWPPEDQPDSTRKSVTKGSIALLLPGLWWLLFPLRSQSGQHFWSVVEGLSIAAIVLTIGAFMLIRLAKAFEEDGTADPDSNVASNKDLKK